jgi:hypothetical protein
VQYVDRTVYVDRPEAPPPPSSDESLDSRAAIKTVQAESPEELNKLRMLQVRRDVFRWGVDMLPEPKSSGAGPSQDVAARELTRWLNLPPGTFTLQAAQPKKPVAKDEEEDE